MVGIEENANLGMIDFTAESNGIGSGIQEVSFVTVQGLDGDSNAVLVEYRAELLEAFHCSIPLVGRAAAAGQITNRRIERTSDKMSRPFQRRLRTQLFKMLPCFSS